MWITFDSRYWPDGFPFEKYRRNIFNFTYKYNNSKYYFSTDYILGKRPSYYICG